MYLADFVQLDNERFYVSANLKTGSIKLERVDNEAIERFIRNIITMGGDRTVPASLKEVSA